MSLIQRTYISSIYSFLFFSFICTWNQSYFIDFKYFEYAHTNVNNQCIPYQTWYCHIYQFVNTLSFKVETYLKKNSVKTEQSFKMLQEKIKLETTQYFPSQYVFKDQYKVCRALCSPFQKKKCSCLLQVNEKILNRKYIYEEIYISESLLVSRLLKEKKLNTQKQMICFASWLGINVLISYVCKFFHYMTLCLRVLNHSHICWMKKQMKNCTSYFYAILLFK